MIAEIIIIQECGIDPVPGIHCRDAGIILYLNGSAFDCSCSWKEITECNA